MHIVAGRTNGVVYEVYLDERLLQNVVEADDERGYAVQIFRMPLLGGGSVEVTRVAYGTVRIVRVGTTTQSEGRLINERSRMMAMANALDKKTPPVCSDFDRDCKDVENHTKCWLHDPSRGACPFIYKEPS